MSDNASVGFEKTEQTCNMPTTSIFNYLTATCEDKTFHSAYLAVGIDDKATRMRQLTFGGIGATPDHPRMYKYGWQFSLGSPMLHRFPDVLTNGGGGLS